MNKEFAPYNIALKLKELGFDEPCFAWHVSESFGLEYGKVVKSDLIKDGIVAPTFSQAFRWFREKHELNSWVYNSQMDKYFYTILQGGRIVKANESVTTYEQAELACLRKLIEIVKK